MALVPGTKLGPFVVQSALGAGGMGEVYRARDTRLDRNVALKALPAAVRDDPERLARFAREAQVLASLNHPNIAAIYALESADAPVLVMELVPGEDLAQRLARGPMPLPETMETAQQVAAALEAAHERGVIHRDLKPANVKITPEGTVKVLDFGLAKFCDKPGDDPDPTNSPTITAVATHASLLLGTAAYMSPEQARGKAVDRRCDVWAFGCLLYEMLTGKRAFHGETVTDILAAIVGSEPDWDALPANVPASVRRLLRRCLAKNLRQRWRDMGDVALELSETTPETAVSALTRRRHWWPPALIVVALLLMAVLAWALARYPVPSEPVRRLSLSDVDFSFASPTAISPDGRLIAFTHNIGAGEQGLHTAGIFVRRLDEFQARLLPGTEGGRAPFFSPDSAWIGYASPGGLMKVRVAGGAPQKICPATAGTQGAWGVGDTIVFSRGIKDGVQYAGLMRVSAAGGQPQVLTELDTSQGERAHAWPAFLPAGDAVIFNVRTDSSYHIEAVSLSTRRRKVLVEEASSPVYSPSGYLLYGTQPSRSLNAVPFEPKHLAVTGAPFTVLPTVPSVSGFDGKFGFDLSQDGTLIYSTVDEEDKRTVNWVDRRGNATPLITEIGFWTQPRISPDGERVLLRKVATDCDIWSYDLRRHVLTRLIFGSDNHDPLWTSDGKRITYDIPAGSPVGVVWKSVDDSSAPELLYQGDMHFRPISWTRDGRHLALSRYSQNNDEIWVLSADGDRKPKPFLQGPYNVEDPEFSPDGRYLAYTSDESGREQVYVRPYQGPGGAVQISSEGGRSPLWSRSGRELFYINGKRMMSVAVTNRSGISFSTPTVLFEHYFPVGMRNDYDISPDGQHFLLPEVHGAGSSEVRVVLNFPAELKRLATAGEGK